MDKMEIPPPDEAVWTFDGGGVYCREEHEVTVRYADAAVIIEVGTDSVSLAVGKYGTDIATAIYAAMTMTEPSR